MLSEIERRTIPDQVGDLEYLQSGIEDLVSRFERAFRHGMSDDVAGIVDQLRNVMGGIDHKIGTLMRS
jgi:hypothetical protein